MKKLNSQFESHNCKDNEEWEVECKGRVEIAQSKYIQDDQSSQLSDNAIKELYSKNVLNNVEFDKIIISIEIMTEVLKKTKKGIAPGAISTISTRCNSKHY
jgi:hypothetical protein